MPTPDWPRPSYLNRPRPRQTAPTSGLVLPASTTAILIASLPWKESMPGFFSYSEQRDDLFACDPAFSLAHCVSADLRMGRGIAVEFKKRFGRLDELARQEPRIGDALTLRRYDPDDDVSDVSSWIYYLVTKNVCYHKPHYAHLESAPSFHRLPNQ